MLKSLHSSNHLRRNKFVEQKSRRILTSLWIELETNVDLIHRRASSTLFWRQNVQD